MKTTIKTILDSTSAMNKLIKQDLTLKTAYQLSILVDKLNPQINFFNSRREILLNKKGPELDKEVEELLKMDVEIDIDRITVPLDENAKLTVLDLRALSAFVEFKEVTDNGG